jgi:hypothetical protein
MSEKKPDCGFFKLDKVYAIGVLVFLICSLLTFLPGVRNTFWLGGLTASAYLLTLLVLAVPIFNMIVAAVKNRN